MPRRSWLLNGELLVEETYIPKTNMTMEKQQLEDGATCVDSSTKVPPKSPSYLHPDPTP